MPWRVKRQLYMILLGCACLVLGAVVAVRDRGVDLELLGYVGIVGGAAIILNILPDNGHDRDRDR
jgi:hypothetical protein